MTEIPEPEFSRPVQLSEILEEGITLHIQATAQEREALARLFGAVEVERLTAEVALYPQQQGPTRWQLESQVRAQIVQSCVVTLEPVSVNNDFHFKRAYARCAAGEARAEVQHGGDEVLTLDQDDAPEPLPGGVIDVGEAIAEELALALDPFPRAAGVVFGGYSVGPGAETDRVNPFAALAKRRSNDQEKKE
jgi:uncharacterized metal-binding protein YceD (DUF177 family)